MSDVVVFEAGKTAQYLKSVNTPDYINADTLINPDLSAIKDVPIEHWARVGDNIVEMNASQKLTLENDKQIKVDEQIEALNIDAPTLANALIAAGVISKTDLINAIKGL